MSLLVSLEFTDTECKVALVDQAKHGRVSVKSLSTFALPKPDDLAARATERAQALRDHLKAQRITVKHAVVVIPKNFVMARSVTLPSTVDSEIAGMAKFEAERHIPFNAERHIISYDVLARQGMQGSDVLLAAVDLPIAQEYLDICVKCGLTVNSITVSSIALFNAFAVAEKTAMADRTVMILNVGRGATDLVVATNGNVTFTRGSTTGVDRLLTDLSDATGKKVEVSNLVEMNALEPQLYFRGPAAEPTVTPGVYDILPGQEEALAVEEGGSTGFQIIPPSAATAPGNPAAAIFTEWLNKLLQEIKRTYEFANREFNCPMMNHIYISGEGATIQQIAQFFQANFNVDAAVFNPLLDTETTSKIKKSTVPPQVFAVAVGGAIGRHPQTIHINLLPGSYTEARTAKRQQRSYIVTGVLALLALVAAYVYLSDAFTTKRNLLSDLVERNSKDKARVADLRTKKERLRIIRENVQDDRGALDVLKILSEKEYFPDTTTLTNFDYKRGDYVKMQGHAKDLKAANQLVNDLRNTGFFIDAKLDSTEPNVTLRGRPPIAVLGWNATFTFPKPAKPKAKSAKPTTDEENLDGTE